MDFELPLEVRMLRDLVRGFVDKELIPLEPSVPETEAFPDEILKPLQQKAKALGLWLLNYPTELGGMGLGLLEACVVQEELGRTKAMPFRNSEVFGALFDPVLVEHCTPEQRERFLLPWLRGDIRICFAQSEPDAGTDPSGMRTRAAREGNHYILNGTKRFISNASISDYAEVFCVTDPERRGRGRITCLMVDLKAPGVSVARVWPTMMGDEPGEITFENARVPVANRIGPEGDGFVLGQQYLTAQRVSGQCAWSIGVAQRALDIAMDYAGVRTTFGQPLSERQAVQFMVADSALDLHAARLLVYHAAWKYDRGMDIRDESYMAKIFCVEAAGRVVDRALQILGGVGLTKALPVEYFYRQIRSLRITEGATEVLRWRLARNLMRARGAAS